MIACSKHPQLARELLRRHPPDLRVADHVRTWGITSDCVMTPARIRPDALRSTTLSVPTAWTLFRTCWREAQMFAPVPRHVDRHVSAGVLTTAAQRGLAALHWFVAGAWRSARPRDMLEMLLRFGANLDDSTSVSKRRIPARAAC